MLILTCVTNGVRLALAATARLDRGGNTRFAGLVGFGVLTGFAVSGGGSFLWAALASWRANVKFTFSSCIYAQRKKKKKEKKRKKQR